MKRFTWFVPLGLLLGAYLYVMRAEWLGIAFVFAYTTIFSILLTPVCKKLELCGMNRQWAAGCAVTGLFLISFVMLAALIPQLILRSFDLGKRIAPVAGAVIGEWKTWSESNVFMQSVISDSGGMLGATINRITGKIAKAGMTAASQLGRVAFSLVLTYYVLCDRRRIANHLLLLVPLSWRSPILLGLNACKNAMLSYFSGMIKTSVFVSCTMCAGLLMLGIQDALLLSALMGVFEVLPYLGPILASIPILLCAMTQGIRTTLLALALIVFVQQIEGNVISPYFTASSTSVHPLAAILSVFIFGSLIGFWGIMIAIPLVVIIQSVRWSWEQTVCLMRDE